MVSMLLSCTGIPDGLKSVESFEIERYLGKWYEIARLDHSFERNMSNVSATYTRNEADGITVVNRGYNTKENKWKSIKGVARKVGDNDQGSLEVSFFRPFYGSYNIIDLDYQDYSYAMVVGPSRSYFWILSRDKVMDKARVNDLVDKAAGMGIDTGRLIYVKQDLFEG
jgi:apolipoprotein D and lipocalin family protein